MNISVANSRSRRETVFPILTLLVALVWAGGTWKVAAHVKGINSFRATLAILTTGMSGNRSPQSIPFRPMFPGLSVPVQPNPPDETLKTLRHSGCVEAVVFVWQIIMYALAAVAAVVGLLSLWRRGFIRWGHLILAALFLLSPIATRVGMNILMDPEKGGLQRLSPLTFLLMALGQSAYAVVLLAAFARRARPVVPKPA